MARLALLALLLALGLAGGAWAQPVFPPQVLVCDGAGERPSVSAAGCVDTLPTRVDPQGRRIWVLAPLPDPGSRQGRTLRISAAAASEAWLNGVYLGSVGRTGATAAEERPGRYDGVLAIPDGVWRPSGNLLVMRMSSFHNVIRLSSPVGFVWIGQVGYASPRPNGETALAFLAAGVLAAGALYFAAVYAARRGRANLILGAMAGVAVLQAVAEGLRAVWSYPYPVHAWRVMAILALAGAFALLLTAFMAQRFWPARWRLLTGATGVMAVLAAAFVRGFDGKTAAVLLAGAAMAGAASLRGVTQRSAGAVLASVFLALFIAALAASPYAFIDLAFYLMAAVLTSTLLAAEVARQRARDDAREAALTRAATRPDRLTVATAKGVQVVLLADLIAVRGADDYAELILVGDRRLLHAATLDHLAASLPEAFVRTHRSAIANLARARALNRTGASWTLELEGGVAVPVSRARQGEVRRRLEGDADLPLSHSAAIG